MQGIAYYILSQLVVWEVDFPGGVDINNVKFRAVVWAVSEVLLIMVVALNYLPRKLSSTPQIRSRLTCHHCAV